MKTVVQFSAVKLNLPDIEDGTPCIANLQHQQPSFTFHWDHLSLDDRVQEFRAVIGQDREMVHIGDFVELSSSHYEEVCVSYFYNFTSIYCCTVLRYSMDYCSLASKWLMGVLFVFFEVYNPCCHPLVKRLLMRSIALYFP